MRGISFTDYLYLLLLRYAMVSRFGPRPERGLLHTSPPFASLTPPTAAPPGRHGTNEARLLPVTMGLGSRLGPPRPTLVGRLRRLLSPHTREEERETR